MEGDIKGAIAEFAKMHIANPGNNRIKYNYACVLSRGNQADSAFKYLHLLLKSDPSFHPLTDPDLVNLREDKRWGNYEEALFDAMHEKGYPIKDREYARALFRLLCMDQYCFYETVLAVRKLGQGSPVVSALRRLQATINEKNLKELEGLLVTRGWPVRSQVGTEAAGAAFFVLQHSGADAQQKYIQLFEKSCRENEADWQQYALMFDRMRMNQKLPQRYGTHIYMDNRYPGENVLYPLEDESKVDEWRKEAGLEPLNVFMKKENISFKPSGSR
jgi:hypothetical protein